MADLFEKAVLIGIGLEKKAKEVLSELEKAAVSEKGAEGEAKENLTSRQLIENKVVEDGVKALKEFLSVINSAKGKLEREFTGSSEKVMHGLNVATKDDLDVVKEMARVAREKVDKLEKRITALEEKLLDQEKDEIEHG